MQRIGLVVHPRRPLEVALEHIREWARKREADVVQIPTDGQERTVAPPGDVAGCDVVLAVGGDGTALTALHAAAAAGLPVLGVACGSLGALTAVGADRVRSALDRFAAGEWQPRALPGIEVQGTSRLALNDIAVVRDGPTQVIIGIFVDDALYAHVAGDGVVVATPMGSSAYTMAAGGPVVLPGAAGLVVTPLAAHGGCAPPLVLGEGARVRLQVDSGWGGARLEIDGRQHALTAPGPELRSRPGCAVLVTLGDDEPVLAGLRRRGIILDSPRVQARSDRRGDGAEGDGAGAAGAVQR